MDEFTRISRMTRYDSTAAVGQDGVLVGIGDDAAVVSPGSGRDIVMACDTMVETIHFNRRTMHDEDIGYKAMAANVSDIVAMGAVPAYALVSITIPRRWRPGRIDRIYEGLYACAARYGVRIVGGDTTASPRHLAISVSLFGLLKPGKALLRSSARPGDVVFVTGEPGCAAAGLHYLMHGPHRVAPQADKLPAPYARLVRAHQRPTPNVRAGEVIAAAGGTRCALNDISDGLASECKEISQASGYALVVHDSMLPVARELADYAAECGRSAFDWLLYGGEDYSLVGTLPPASVRAVRGSLQREGVPFAVIGEVSSRRTRDGLLLRVDRAGRTLAETRHGFNHFA